MISFSRLGAFVLSAAAVWAESSVQVPAWTADGSEVTQESLAAAVNGNEARVVSLRGPADDLMLIVVLDLTDDLAAVTAARNALIERLGSMKDNHFVGVMAAQNGLSVLSAPGADRAATAAALRSHPVGGRPGLLNTIEDAARIGSTIELKSGVRVAVLYITDSDISNYRENYNNAVVNSSDRGDLSRQVSDQLVRERISRMTASLAATSAPVFISQLSYKTDQLNVAYQTGLLALADATGGTAAVARSVAEIPAGVNELMDRIEGHYSVSVAVPEGTANEVAVKLEARAGSPLTHRTNFVLAP